MSLKLNVIVTSIRPGRIGPKIGKWMADFAKANSDFDVNLVDLADFDLPLLDEAKHPMMQDYQHEHTKRWSEVNAKADAFVFVSPEYDYFPAASTVNAIQTLHKEWNKKPVGLVGSQPAVEQGAGAGAEVTHHRALPSGLTSGSGRGPAKRSRPSAGARCARALRSIARPRWMRLRKVPSLASRIWAISS